MKFHDKDYDRILSIISREGETIEVCAFLLTDLSVYVNVAVVIPVSSLAQQTGIRRGGASHVRSSFRNYLNRLSE